MILDMKSELKDLAKGIAFIAVIWITISYFSKSIYHTWGILVGFNGIILLYLKKFTVISWIKNMFIIALLLFALYMLAPLGIWGWVITIVLIIGYILYSRWDRFIEVKQHIESMLWGKPLKEFIKGKDKPPKIKIVIK